MAHVPAGKSGELVWTFNRAGEFDFACLVAGHYQAGMVGKISVRLRLNSTFPHKEHTMQRRQLIQAMAMPSQGAAMHHRADGANQNTAVEVWKDPDCGCCKDWVDHLQANGFAVRVHDSGNTAARKRLGMPRQARLLPYG
jgi:hypothetical protein